MRKVIIIVMLLLAALPAAAKDSSNHAREYEAAAKLLEEKENEYLQKRFTFIELKKKIKDRLESLDNEAGDLIDRRNRLREEILATRKEAEAVAGKIENQELRMSEITSFQSSAVSQLIKEAERMVPYITYDDLNQLKGIRDSIRSGKDFTRAGRELLDYLESVIDTSRQFSLEPGERLTGNNIPVKGTRIRLGTVFYGFLPEKGGPPALLLHDNTSDSAYSWNEDIPGSSRSINRFVKEVHSGDIVSELPIDVMQSSAAVKQYRSGTVFSGFFDWFGSGGPVMYAVLAILIYALYLMGERFIVLHRNSVDTDSLMESVMDLVKKKNLQKVRELCDSARGTLPRVIRSLVDQEDVKNPEIEQKLNEIMLHEIPHLEKHLPTLKSLGGLAPLLGLLGTVTGMISLFDVITAHGTGDPKLLAGGIAEALVTTEFGLIVAIPVLLAHRVLLNRAESLISDIERYGLTLLNTLHGR